MIGLADTGRVVVGVALPLPHATRSPVMAAAHVTATSRRRNRGLPASGVGVEVIAVDMGRDSAHITRTGDGPNADIARTT